MPFNLYKVIIKFVINRRYVLKIDGIITDHTIEPKSSVPQGSHSGPPLFMIYINDFKFINGVFHLRYADDTKIYKEINNNEDRQLVQQQINELNQ